MRKKLMYTLMSLLILLGLAACQPQTDAQFEPDAVNNVEANDNDDELALQPVTPVVDEIIVETDSIEVEEGSALQEAAQTEEADPILIYEQQGGLKGIGPSTREWRFYGNGRIVGSDGTSWEVEPEIVETLIVQITASGFQSLEKSYIPEDICCDRITHIITLQIEDEIQIVETLDGADMPQSLEANIQKINELLMGLYE